MIGLDFSCTFVLLILLDGGHALARLLVHVVVGVYPHLVLDVAHVLQLLALALLDALHRAAALDVREGEAELGHIVAVRAAAGKRQVALAVGELDGGIECGAEFGLIALKLLDGPEGRIGQLDVDQFLVAAAGCVFLGLMLLGQSIAPSAQSGHLELLLLLLLLRGQQLNNTTLAVVVFVVVVVVAVVLFGVESVVSRESS